MASRHIKVLDLKLRRLAELQLMLGTGQGIGRVPSKTTKLIARIAIFSGTPAPRINPNLVEGTLFEQVHPAQRQTMVFVPGATGTRVIEIPDTYVSLPMEADMGHYRMLANEKRLLEQELMRGLVTGYAFPRHAPSPFGADRFRKFDPTPAFEVVIGEARARRVGKVSLPAFALASVING